MDDPQLVQQVQDMSAASATGTDDLLKLLTGYFDADISDAQVQLVNNFIIVFERNIYELQL